MEGDQEMKQHACKFCNKRFPCGRSLGGHMRSHITNLSSETEEKEKLVSTKRKLSSLNNNAVNYGLRENPKKTWRISDSSEETLVSADKFCKECGKGFQSWKALFGHMKCHSDKERNSNSFEDQDSWSNHNRTRNSNSDANAREKVVMDSQSDNEVSAPNRRKRSKRRTRYSAVTTSSLSFANPSASSVSEVEQEQEEVAMSLMMLSRDLTPWNSTGIVLHSSLAESSDNNSVCFETNLEKLIKKSHNFASGNMKFKGKSSELLDAEFKIEVPFIKKNEKASNFVLSQLENSVKMKNRVNETESMFSKSTIANKFTRGSELKSNSSSFKNWVGESSKNSNKRGKFECTTCNKIFHSYQALGGHRASHKKIKGCFASKNESSQNSIETELSPDPTTESKFMKNSESEYLVGNNEAENVSEFKKNSSTKVHECPICFKVFPSGQALGGHKRSHLVAESEARNFQAVVPEIRNFLDLNLPAAATEDESNSHADSNRSPWWVVEENHKQEQPLVGLLSS